MGRQNTPDPSRKQNPDSAGESERPSTHPTRQYFAFSSGEVIAGRFQVIRIIGHGGMGEVYEAIDSELQEKVALKTIRSEIAGNPKALERFRREIQLARRVTHPNVCRVFDVFRHRVETEHGTSEIYFFSMQFLEGITLRELIRRRGRIPETECLPIINELASALEAAHEAGIVHRDFKSANVMITGSGSASRAVITDFGLSRSENQAQQESITERGSFLGTPEYIAPEQVEGKTVSPATDVYSLGIVLYEMLTGRVPYQGDSSMSVAVKHLTEKPESPAKYAPDLSARMVAVVLRCLEKNPEDRFQSASEVIQTLKLPPPPSALKRSWKPALVAVAALGFGAGIYFYTSVVRHPSRPAQQLAYAKGRPSIAVWGFKNLSGNDKESWISLAVAEMLTTELAAGEQLRIIPGETVAHGKQDLSLPDVQTFEKETLLKIGLNLSADYIVLGSYVSAGNDIRFDFRVQDTHSGETKASFSETGTRNSLPDLASRSGMHLRKFIGLENSNRNLNVAQSSFPSKPEAIQLYAEGLSKLRVYEFQSAQETLEKAVALEPRFAMAHSALSEAWTDIGYTRKAKEQAKAALELSQNLSREDRLLAQSRYHNAAGEKDKAIETYQTLFKLFPDNVEYGLKLAEVQNTSGKAEDALKTIEAMRKWSSPGSEDPRIDLVESKTRDNMGDYKTMLRLAGSAERSAKEIGARRLLAKAYSLQSSAFYSLGEIKKAKEMGTRAFELYAETNDQKARAEYLVAKVTVAPGGYDQESAKADLMKALKIYLSLDDRVGVANVYFILANKEKDPLQSDDFFQKSYSAYEEIENLDGMGVVLTNWGIKSWSDGKPVEGQQRLERALDFFRKSGNSHNTAAALMNTSAVYFSHGDLEKTLPIHQEVIKLENDLGHKLDAADISSQGLSNLFRDMGRLEDARQTCEKALAVFIESSNESQISRTESLLARILLAEGQYEAARKKYEEAKQHSKGLEADYSAYDFVFYSLRETSWQFLFAQDKLDELRLEYEKMKTDSRLKSSLEFIGTDEIDLRVAQLTLETDPAKSRAQALQLLHSLENKDYGDLAAKCRILVCESYFREGKPTEAESSFAAAEPVLKQFQQFFEIHVRSEILRAKLLAAKGKYRPAQDLLTKVLKETRQAKYAALEFEVLLALGEIERNSGSREQGNALLQNLQKDALSKGYLLVWRKAAALQAITPESNR